MTTCSHPIPVEAPLRPSPLSSPSNEQAHHMRLLRPCRYDCEQKDLVDEENCGSRIADRGFFDWGLGIADCGFSDCRSLTPNPPPEIADCEAAIEISFNPQSAIRNPQSEVFVYFGIRVSLRASGGRRSG